MRILVTGGLGFIGSHLVERLLRGGHEVVVLDLLTYAGRLDNIKTAAVAELHIADVACEQSVRRAAQGCDAVINLAAETHVDRSIADSADFVRTNVEGARVLLEWARESGCRLVQVSTDEVYGDRQDAAQPALAREDDPLRPSSPYAASKAAADLLCFAYHRTHGTDVVITRGSNTYGPRQHPEKALPRWITSALRGEPMPLYGDGEHVREWLHVEDHVEAILLALDHGLAGEAHNVGSGERITNRELVVRVLTDLRSYGVYGSIEYVPDRPGHDRLYALQSATTRTVLGWVPRYTLQRGLAETIAWYCGNRDWWEAAR